MLSLNLPLEFAQRLGLCIPDPSIFWKNKILTPLRALACDQLTVILRFKDHVGFFIHLSYLTDRHLEPPLGLLPHLPLAAANRRAVGSENGIINKWRRIATDAPIGFNLYLLLFDYTLA